MQRIVEGGGNNVDVTKFIAGVLDFEGKVHCYLLVSTNCGLR